MQEAADGKLVLLELKHFCLAEIREAHFDSAAECTFNLNICYHTAAYLSILFKFRIPLLLLFNFVQIFNAFLNFQSPVFFMFINVIAKVVIGSFLLGILFFACQFVATIFSWRDHCNNCMLSQLANASRMNNPRKNRKLTESELSATRLHIVKNEHTMLVRSK